MSRYAADMSLRFYELRFVAHLPAVYGVFAFIDQLDDTPVTTPTYSGRAGPG